MEQRAIKVGNFEISNRLPFALLAGPCQIESRQHAIDMAGALVEITKELGINYIFKASFDKANRTSINTARGVGIDEGIRIKKAYAFSLSEPKNQQKLSAPLTDIAMLD